MLVLFDRQLTLGGSVKSSRLSLVRFTQHIEYLPACMFTFLVFSQHLIMLVAGFIAIFNHVG